MAAGRGRGRALGSAGKVSRQAKENILDAFEFIGGVDALAAWARKNRTEFYKLYARLIPVTVHAAVDVRHASEYSDDELARIVARSSREGAVIEAESAEGTGSVH
jgi:hypothetical protein